MAETTISPPPFPDGFDPQAALDAATQTLDANAEVLNGVHEVMAQPIGELVNGNKQVLRKIDNRLIRVASGNLARNSQVIQDTHAILGGSIQGPLDLNAGSLTTIGNIVAATGFHGPRPHPSPGAPPPPPPRLPPPPTASGQLWNIWFNCTTCGEQFLDSNAHSNPGYTLVQGGFTSYAFAVAWWQANQHAWREANCPHCNPQPPSPGVPTSPPAGAGGPGMAPVGALPQLCLYIDCAAFTATFNAEGQQTGGAQWGYVTAAPCQGDSIPCPAGVACLSHTWTRYPGITGTDAFTMQQLTQQQRAQIYAWCHGAAPPPPPAPPPPGPLPPPPGGPGGLPPPSPAPAPTTQCVKIEPCAPIESGPCAIDAPSIVFPAIGSPEFIAGSKLLRGAFVQIGQQVVAYVTGQISALAFPDTISETTDPSAPSWANVLLPGFTQALVGFIQGGTKGAGKAFTDTINCWITLANRFDGCNLPEVLFLVLCRSLVRILGDFELGWDIGIWAITRLNLHLDPIEKVLDYLIADACPAELPGFGDITEAWLRGGMDDDTKDALLRFQGIDKDVWYNVIRSRRERLQQWEHIQYLRRIGWTDDQIQPTLRSYGYLTDKARAARMEMSYVLPTITNHLHWQQRNVFDPLYVKQYNLLDGFATDSEIQALDPGYAGYTTIVQSGRNFWQAFGADLHAQGWREKYAALDYAAHWIIPAPGTLAEMVQRLRPNGTITKQFPNLVFTTSDFSRLLAEQDIAPFFRDRLLAIAYRTLPLRQLNQAAQQGRFNRAELAERWQDIGFNATDAQLMADTLLVLAERQKASLGKGYTPTTVAKLSIAGLITIQQAQQVLAPQGFSANDVQTLFTVAQQLETAKLQEKYLDTSILAYAKLAAKAYGEGAVDAANATAALLNAGYTPQAAGIVISTIDLQQQFKAVTAAVKSIHKARLIGEVDNAGALAALQSVGVPALRANQYVQQWALELTVPRISASTARIMAWMKKGLLSVANGSARLANLGWNPPDVVLMIAEVQQALLQAKAKANAASAKQLAQAQKAAQSLVKQTQKQFCKIYSLGRMKSWYAKRIIDDATFTQRLVYCGLDPAGVAAALKEAQVARAALDLKTEKNGATGIEYTGPGAIPGGPPP